MSTSASKELWDGLSNRLSELTAEAGKSVVAVESGYRVSASGVHWKPGVVVTAAHLVRRAETVNVLTAGNESISGRVVGRDASTDLAAIRLEGASELRVLPFGSNAKPGELVLAVGRSRRGEAAIAWGVMARVGGPWRTWRGGHIDRLLRPDVQLYPGQSGSALINGEGEVLGINSAVLARASAITVPVETVDRVVSELLEHGHISRPYFGVAMQEVPLPDEWQSAAGQAQALALLVTHVTPESPAKRAGVLIGDLLVSVDGQPLQGYRALHGLLSQKHSGDPLAIRLIRAGAVVEINATVGDRPQR